MGLICRVRSTVNRAINMDAILISPLMATDEPPSRGSAQGGHVNGQHAQQFP